MQNKTVLSVLFVFLAIIVAGGIVFAVNNRTKQDQATMEQVTPSPMEASPTTGVTSEPSGAMEKTSPTAAEQSGATKTFTVVGTNFAFSPTTIKVKKGDSVTVTFKNDAGFHDFVIDELNVRTEVLGAGKSQTVTFVADKAGTFAYYCSVGNHRKMGMEGKLIVE